MQACNGHITTVDETGQLSLGKDHTKPNFAIYNVGIKDGVMRAYIIGGWGDGSAGWIDSFLYAGEPQHVPTIGTFTLLDVTPARSVDGHGSATLCFEPDPDFEASDRI